jgi:predicted thioesterase
VVATDDAGEVSRGTHDRAIIDAAAFAQRLDV